MITTLHALLIAVFVLVPGFVADRAHREFVGSAKRDATYQILLWLALSLVSGALYTGAAYVTHRTRLIDWPFLEYSTLDWLYRPERQIPAIPPRWLFLLSLHLATAAVLGLAMGLAGRNWDVFGLGYRYQTTWDHTLTKLSSGRYVLVTLKDGTMWHGSILIANRLADLADRDLVLNAPRVFTHEGGLGAPDDRKFLYVRGDELETLAFLATREERPPLVEAPIDDDREAAGPA